MLYQLSYLPGHGSTYARIGQKAGNVNSLVNESEVAPRRVTRLSRNLTWWRGWRAGGRSIKAEAHTLDALVRFSQSEFSSLRQMD